MNAHTSTAFSFEMINVSERLFLTLYDIFGTLPVSKQWLKMIIMNMTIQAGAIASW